MAQQTERQFTGKHMILAMVGFFGVIIAVNLAMASFAARSWTGLVVKNSYVASQNFNEAVAAKRQQDKLGWTVHFAAENGLVSFHVSDRTGDTMDVKSAELTFRRPAFDKEDHTVVLSRQPGGNFVASHRLADGVWLVEASVDTGAGKPWFEAFRVTLKNGKSVR